MWFPSISQSLIENVWFPKRTLENIEKEVDKVECKNDSKISSLQNHDEGQYQEMVGDAQAGGSPELVGGSGDLNDAVDDSGVLASDDDGDLLDISDDYS